MYEESWFDSWWGPEVYLYTKVLRPTLGPFHPIHKVPGALSPGLKCQVGS